MASTSSECIICTSEYFVGSVKGKGGKQKNIDSSNCHQKTWKTFVKYFFSPPPGGHNEWGTTIWDLMDVSGMDIKSTPFCLRCRQIMEKLTHFHEQLELIQNEVSKFVNTISNIIVHPDKSTYYDKDGNKKKGNKRMRDDDKYDGNSIPNQISVRRILDDRITKRKELAFHPSNMSSRFNPQILHIPDWQHNMNLINPNNVVIPATATSSTSQRGGGSQQQLFNTPAGVASWQNASLLSSSLPTSNSTQASITNNEPQKSTSYEKFLHNGKYPYERLGSEFRCCTCGTVKSTRQLLMTHLNYHRLLDTKEFACSTCGKVFVRKREVDRHERTHLNNVLEKYTGSVTDMGNNLFSYEGEWTFEGIFQDDDSSGSLGANRQYRRYRCSTCGVEKDKKSSMLSHLRWVHHRKQSVKKIASNNNSNSMQMTSTSSSNQQIHTIHPSLHGCDNPLGWVGHQVR